MGYAPATEVSVAVVVRPGIPEMEDCVSPLTKPVYVAVRSYLEMDQRVALLQERVGVIADLLAVLKDQLSHTHGEFVIRRLIGGFGHVLIW